MSDNQNVEPVEPITRTALSHEEAQVEGFFGEVRSYPNELHHTGNEMLRQATFQVTETVPTVTAEGHRATLAGAVVNSDDAPTPSEVSGPGASQPSRQDENEEDEG